MWTNLRDENSKAIQAWPGKGSWGRHTFVSFYLQKSDLVLTVTIREKSPHTFARGWGKRTLLKYTTTFCS